MKVIGRSSSNGWIVEFNVDEYAALLDAQNAANDLDLDVSWMGRGDPRIDSDMKQFFDAMRLFCLAKFKINEMMNAVKAIEASLGIDKPKKENQ